MTDLINNNTWEMVDIPEGAHFVGANECTPSSTNLMRLLKDTKLVLWPRV